MLLSPRSIHLYTMSENNDRNSADSANATPLQTLEDQPLQAPKGASAFARVLYRKLQAAMDAHDDVESFNLLLQLIKESPDDAAASQLARKIGQRIYKDVAKELPVVLSGGNMSQIAQLVSKLRLMADDAQLAELPGFRSAADKVDAAERKYWEAMLLSGICKMRETANIRDRESMAVSIENFVVAKKLQLNAEQKAMVDKVHADWAQHCHLEELREKLRAQQEDFELIQKRVATKRDLRQCRDDLKFCYDATAALRELPETGDLLEKIDASLKHVKAVLFAQLRRKTIVRSVTVLIIAAIIFIIVTVTYAFISAGGMRDDLHNARGARNLTMVQGKLEGLEPLRWLRSMLSPSYAEELELSSAWLEEYHSLCKKLDEIEPKLRMSVEALNNPGVSPAQMTSGLVVLEQADKMCSELDSRFNRQCKPELRELMAAYTNRMADIRPSVLGRFSAPSPDMTLEDLNKLYEEYQGCRSLLKVTDEEHQEIRRAFTSSVSVVLSRMSAEAPTPEQAASIVEEFDKYNSSMQLDKELRDSLADYSRRFKLFNELPQTLTTVTDLASYVTTIEACGDCYDRVPGAISVAELTEIVGQENAAMRAYKLAEFTVSNPLEIEAADVPAYLQKIRAIYADGAPLFELSSKTEKLNDLITDVCTDPQNVWKKGLTRFIGYGNYVHTGKLVGEKKVQQFNIRGQSSGKPALAHPKSEPVEVKLADQRRAMGFVPEDLKSGKITPAQLLMNIARHNEPGCPVFARAYLFRQTMRMIEELDPTVSGLAFSPSLKADIEAFKQLPGMSEKKRGCWLPSHKLDEEKAYEEFFASIAAHDYRQEILAAIMPITDSVCSFAGFIDVEGKPVLLSQDEQQLYLLKNGQILPFVNTQEAPYTPLFKITLPAAASAPQATEPAAAATAEEAPEAPAEPATTEG